MKNTEAIILAAGAGTRMRTEMPKVLHRAGAETLLGRVISSLKKSGVHDIITVTGYEGEKIKEEFADDVRFVDQENLLGSGDAVRVAVKALKKSTEHVIVTCGDTPLINSGIFDELLEKHMEKKVSCTFLTCVTEEAFSYGRIIRTAAGEVEAITEEIDLLPEQKKIKEINVGTYCFSREDLEKHVEEIEKNNVKNEFYLTDIVAILKKNGKKVASVDCNSWEAIGVNSRKEIAIVNNIIKNATLDRLMKEGVTIVDPATTYVGETARIEIDTIIFPNTVIEEDVTIGKNCRIGPFARLRPGTRLSDNVEIGNFVEICRSQIGDRTRIKHHAYIGDAVVGSDVNVGAGVITANYDGTKKSRTVIEDGVFIGVGAVLIAPVNIGKLAKIGAGSVVTKNKDVSAGDTVVGVPARPFKK
ncbi:MAG: NTP transferase domain-containing protein [Candidatus Omnitrophota bacterium]